MIAEENTEEHGDRGGQVTPAPSAQRLRVAEQSQMVPYTSSQSRDTDSGQGEQVARQVYGAGKLDAWRGTESCDSPATGFQT